jgi:hypothetical protein
LKSAQILFFVIISEQAVEVAKDIRRRSIEGLEVL